MPSPTLPDDKGATIADVLNRAADRLSKPGAWTQGADSRDAEGNDLEDVDPSDDGDHTPVCWCAGGAVWAESTNAEIRAAAIKILSRAVGADLIFDWNDASERTQAEVVAKLREAAAKALEPGK